MKTTKAFIGVLLLSVWLLSCGHNRDNVKVGGSTDSTSINKAGGPSVPDTNTVNANRKQGKADSTKKDTNAKGNVDPTGRPQKH